MRLRGLRDYQDYQDCEDCEDNLWGPAGVNLIDE